MPIRLPFDRQCVAVPRTLLYAQAALLVVLTVVAFTAGYLIGHDPNEPASEGLPEPERILIDGRLQWEATTGMLADKGAIVLAVPEGYESARKLSGEHLGARVSIPEPSSDLATTLQSWGGDFAVANNHGEFRLFLIPGRYHVLMLSRNALRPVDTGPSRTDLAEIGRFFEMPDRMLGEFQYRWSVETFDADSQLMHDFGSDHE